jgi:hypothetical protein
MGHSVPSPLAIFCDGKPVSHKRFDQDGSPLAADYFSVPLA